LLAFAPPVRFATTFVEYRVKKTVLALLLLAACTPKVATTTRTGPVEPSRPSTATNQPRPANIMPGAESARTAVEQFLTAVHAQDIQAMGVLFGTTRGPSRDNMDREELEKRLVILQCYFDHDKFRILGETVGDAGHRIVTAELTRGANTRTPRFYTITGPGGRWYVDNMEIAAVRDFCRNANGS
jgi:hypothetical protein